MISVTSTYLEELPGEKYLTLALQYPIVFTLGNKLIKQGRLVMFKRVHYYIQIILLNSKNLKETFEIPIPFRTEDYPHEGIIFFDYRVRSLSGKDEDLESRLTNTRIKGVNPSQYFNKILEIKAANV